jgi:hypothetical protein
MIRFPSVVPPRRLSRVEAFTEQGVTLAYPPRSWSGVREVDGAIVIAIREGEVECAMDGFRCLLWSPVIEGATEWVDRPIKAERLHHCRLASFFGGADGLLVGSARGEVSAGSVLAMRVEKRDQEYWAYWGLAARSPRVPACDTAVSMPLPFAPVQLAA